MFMDVYEPSFAGSIGGKGGAWGSVCHWLWIFQGTWLSFSYVPCPYLSV